MSAPSPKARLTERERVQIRKLLRAQDRGARGSTIARIGRTLTNTSGQGGDDARYRIGIALCILAVFLMVWVATLPDGDGRWFFSGIAWITMLVGGWQVDKARGVG